MAAKSGSASSSSVGVICKSIELRAANGKNTAADDVAADDVPASLSWLSVMKNRKGISNWLGNQHKFKWKVSA